ncbi:CoA transferase [Pseudonocardia sp. WMMC193]|uniref:CaiB/BaiF CoA-transferase family protein n=1 Tax=Pseudonocardia sp. WMMC193 TaxID=2911965 RepID=UPI001F248BA6|nr:CoA transferase [Pseudonocardia sp. WMMC193]MCF7550686.1 CoA transferase [Pseudonocardia sp. WMMC193]
MSEGALDGIRVVDFGQYLAGPLTGLFLADNGADVIHVDPPGGPRWDHPVNAALYRGKRSVQLDLKTESGRAQARRLIASADVVIENFRPGVMDRLGLGAASFEAENDRLIWCSLPGFPADDPRADLPGWEGVVCSALGLYPPEGFRADTPRFNPLTLASNFAAFVAAHRIVGALLSRLRTARGRSVEVSLYEAGFESLGQHAEFPQSREFEWPFLAQIVSYLGVRRAADGAYIYFDTPLRGLQALVSHFGLDYDLLQLDAASAERLSHDLDALIAQKPAAEWERLGQEELGTSVGLVQSTREWLHDAHALDSETIVAVDDPFLGLTQQAGFPVLLSGTPASVRWPRKEAVAGTEAPIEWLGEARHDPELPPADDDLPLAGVRVLDCSTLLAGPTTTRVLAQYGAEVIKVDRAGIATEEVDLLTDDLGAFIGHRTVNAGKRMVFLDLRKAASRDIVRSMVSEMDVVHHNFTAAAAEKLGVSTAQIRALNPTVINSRTSLHSEGGWRGQHRGHDMVAQMATGQGYPNGPGGRPTAQSTYINDHASGHLSALGIMLALLHRIRTGEGQDVNGSLSRTATMHQLPFLIDFAGKDWERTAPDDFGWHAFDRLYRAEDGWFYLAAGDRTDAKERLAESSPTLKPVAGVPDADVQAWLEEHFSRLKVDECVSLAAGAGLGAHAYVRLPDLFRDERALRAKMVAVVEHPGIGRALGIGLPTTAASTSKAGRDLVASRRPGMDTITVLAEFGFTDRIVELLEEGAIGVGENPVVNTTGAPGYWGRARTFSMLVDADDSQAIVREVIRES